MGENKIEACYVCTKCRDTENLLHSKNTESDLVLYKCSKWLAENAILEDDLSEQESKTSEAISSSISEITEDTRSEISDCHYRVSNGETIQYINLIKCKNVQLGDVANLHGPVQVNQKFTNVLQNEISNEFFFEGAAKVVNEKKLNIVNRMSYLPRPPVGKIDRMERPVKLVIISHTASKSSITHAGNEELVQAFQTYHIESKRWPDIAYNFLIGCDGMVYEGRGWGAVGNHTLGYNKIAIGISFVGCFMDVLPNAKALFQAKALIEYGIKIGEIDKNYVLIGHCQCRPTESPGNMLFQEIQTWDNWSSTVPEQINTQFKGHNELVM